MTLLTAAQVHCLFLNTSIDKRDQNVNKTYSSLVDKLENEELPACVIRCHETVGTRLK